MPTAREDWQTLRTLVWARMRRTCIHSTSPLSAWRLIAPHGAAPAAPPLPNAPSPRTRNDGPSTFAEASAEGKLEVVRRVRELAAIGAVFQSHEFSSPMILIRKIRDKGL